MFTYSLFWNFNFKIVGKKIKPLKWNVWLVQSWGRREPQKRYLERQALIKGMERIKVSQDARAIWSVVSFLWDLSLRTSSACFALVLIAYSEHLELDPGYSVEAVPKLIEELVRQTRAVGRRVNGRISGAHKSRMKITSSILWVHSKEVE